MTALTKSVESDAGLPRRDIRDEAASAQFAGTLLVGVLAPQERSLTAGGRLDVRRPSHRGDHVGALSVLSLCSPGIRQVGQRVPEGCGPPMSIILGLFCPIEPEDIMEQSHCPG